MIHAIPYLALGLIIVAGMYGLDKDVADALKAVMYFWMGAGFCAGPLKKTRVGRWIALIGLAVAFVTVHVDALGHGKDRPMIVNRAPVSPKTPRVQ